MKQLKIIIYFIIGIMLWGIISWFGFHVLAILGLFITVIYLFIGLLSRNHAICFFCRFIKENVFCLFCKKFIFKDKSTSPQNIRSVLLNSLLLLLLTLLSTGLVYIEYQVLKNFVEVQIHKNASINVNSAGSYNMGEVFPIQFIISGIEIPINTVRVDLQYDPKRVEMVDFSTKNSFATIFIRKNIDNKGGIARLTGGLPNPGFSGDKGLFATAYMKGLKPGIATMNVLSSSVVLANTGSGENILKEVGAFSYIILPYNTLQTVKNGQSNVSLHVVTQNNNESKEIGIVNNDQALGEDLLSTQNSTKPKHIILNYLMQIDYFILHLWKYLIPLINI